MSTFGTTILLDMLGRVRAGDDKAGWELVQITLERLETLTRAILRRFPNVACYEQTGDILTNTLLRVQTRLKKVELTSTRAYYTWVSFQIQQSLIETLRLLNRKTKPVVPPTPIGDPAAGGVPEPTAPATDTLDDLEFWELFHQEVARIPDPQDREVFALSYYQELPPAEIAKVLDIDRDKVYRHRDAARGWLRQRLGGRLNELLDR